MSIGNFRVNTVAPDRLEVSYSGDITPDVADQCAQAAKAIATAQRHRVIVDFCALQSCSLATRTALVNAHRDMRHEGSRIAYVADTSLMRGLALWVCHLSEDDTSKPFATLEQANEWLNDKKHRVDETHRHFMQAAEAAARKVRR